MYQEYKDHIAFYVVYINEAHPTDLWQTQSNLKEGVIFADPTTEGDRERIATSCVRNLHISIPAVIDSLGNAVERDYTGWPDRFYLISKNGEVRFKSGAGPFGFDAKALGAALQMQQRSDR